METNMEINLETNLETISQTIPQTKKILFIGDSITDAKRLKEDESSLGQGFVNLIASKLGYDYPGRFEFLNMGCGGNRIVDLIPRWKTDCLNKKPDIVSILIGVNDVWAEKWGNGVEASKFEFLYDYILTETQEKLPGVKIIICEPFVLEGAATEEDHQVWVDEVKLRGEAAERLANKHNCLFVPLQRQFYNACELAPQPYWLMDGVHPSPAGHKLISKEWFSTVWEMLNEHVNLMTPSL